MNPRAYTARVAKAAANLPKGGRGPNPPAGLARSAGIPNRALSSGSARRPAIRQEVIL